MDDRDPLSLLTRPLAPCFERRVFLLAPGGGRPYDAAEWRDALVIVECGEIELEGRDGGCERFASGALLWLSGLPLRALHNRGPEPAVLVAVSRAQAFPARAPLRHHDPRSRTGGTPGDDDHVEDRHRPHGQP